MCQQPLTCRKLSFCHLCQVGGVIVFPYYWSCLRVHLCWQLGDTGIPPSLFIIIILPPVWSATTTPIFLGDTAWFNGVLGKNRGWSQMQGNKNNGFCCFFGEGWRWCLFLWLAGEKNDGWFGFFQFFTCNKRINLKLTGFNWF